MKFTHRAHSLFLALTSWTIYHGLHKTHTFLIPFPLPTLFSDIAHSLTTNIPSSRRTPLYCCAHSIHTEQTLWRYFFHTVQSIDSALFFPVTHTLLFAFTLQSMVQCTLPYNCGQSARMVHSPCSQYIVLCHTITSSSTPLLLLPCNFILQTCKLIQ